jgi:hypothetical protein
VQKAGFLVRCGEKTDIFTAVKNDNEKTLHVAAATYNVFFF